jgi:hypothetical protein
VLAISGTTSFFVLFFLSVALSLFFPKPEREEIGIASLTQKIVGCIFYRLTAETYQSPVSSPRMAEAKRTE